MRNSLTVVLSLMVVLGLAALVTAGVDKQESTKPTPPKQAVKKTDRSTCPMGSTANCPDVGEKCKDANGNCPNCPSMADHCKDSKMNAAACPHNGTTANGKASRPAAHTAHTAKAAPNGVSKVSAAKVKLVPAKNAKVSAATPKAKAAKSGCCSGGGH